MPIGCRRARFSSCRAARERKIEERVASRVLREMSIGGKNYKRSIIPLRSDISRFSRGTIDRIYQFSELLAQVKKTLKAQSHLVLFLSGCSRQNIGESLLVEHHSWLTVFGALHIIGKLGDC